MTFPDLAALKDFAGWKAARAPHAVGPGPDHESLRLAYLGLLKLALCDLTGTSTGSVSQRIDGSIASRELRGEDRRLRAGGIDWPLHGLTMVGLNRLDDLQACVESVVRDGVEGDLIEAGTWRGGAAILMRATLDSLGATDRTVHVADSFQGFPAADEHRRPQRQRLPRRARRRGARQLRAPRPRPRRARSSRASSRRRCRRSTTERWAVVRLDGDTYEATRAALDALYPRLAVGGYLIVDDYDAMTAEECRRAVDEFRAEHGIAEPLETVDWTCVRWRREERRADRVRRRRAARRPPAPRRSRARTRRTCRPAASSISSIEVAALQQQLSGRSWRRRLMGRGR